ncbi:MAG: hypothetical protein LBM65_07010, partial [Oscillospiraceae bacterium]|nr:hypothetical protein [Oscillospiraceae bacterium]
MKMLKISWFVFAPVVLLLSVFGVLAAIYLQGTQTIMGVNAIGASYIFVLIAVALAVALKIISLTDKTTSGFCLDKKSTASGVFALLLAVFAVLSCVESVITLFQQDVIDWFA